MDITELINHPERLDRETLYELRSMLAVFPFFQTARLLMLQNLYLLHDPTFDEELRRAAVYITDRSVIFQMIEAAHYRMAPAKKSHADDASAKSVPAAQSESRTISLIDNFLDTIPKEEKPEGEGKGKKGRQPTPADAAVDYVAYLMEMEGEEEKPDGETPQLKGQSLIDDFINKDQGKIVLSDTPQFVPQIDDNPANGKDGDESYFTETLARIYIKQERYSKALEIIRRLSLNYPKKNAYFADQIRFLEKLIINNNKKTD
jgi:hypothetical protein